MSGESWRSRYKGYAEEGGYAGGNNTGGMQRKEGYAGGKDTGNQTETDLVENLIRPASQVAQPASQVAGAKQTGDHPGITPSRTRRSPGDHPNQPGDHPKIQKHIPQRVPELDNSAVLWDRQ